jgi:hypothetical protein
MRDGMLVTGCLCTTCCHLAGGLLMKGAPRYRLHAVADVQQCQPVTWNDTLWLVLHAHLAELGCWH